MFGHRKWGEWHTKFKVIGGDDSSGFMVGVLLYYHYVRGGDI
jgi:hypothetical protein